MTRLDAFAACLPGLEPLVASELEDLGLPGTRVPGGVTFTAELTDVMRAVHWLGCASHVRLRVAEFRCRALGELQRKARDLPWPDWLRPSVPLLVRGTSSRSRVFHTKAIAERVTDAVHTVLGGLPSAPPLIADDQDADGPAAAQLAVRFHNDVCTISLDATTTPLHRRGYRLAGGKAPLREDLAHAVARLALAGERRAVLDPFCGSGTIPIEAAGLLRGLAPGRLREPPLSHLAAFDSDAWAAALAAAPTGLADTAAAPLPVHGSDRDRGAIDAARQNAERAGLGDAIEFSVGAFAAHPWLQDPGQQDPGQQDSGQRDQSAPEHGVIATNPPFGRRIGKRDLVNLYQTVGHRLRRLPGWRVVLLAQDLRLARRTGLLLQAGFTTRHGGLSVSALTGTVPAP